MAINFMPLPDEFFEETEELGDAEFGRLVRWGLNYHLTGQTTALNGNERFYAKRLKMQIDRYHDHYDEIATKRSAAGKASANKRTQQMSTYVSKCQQVLTNDNKCMETNTNTNTKTNTKTNTLPSIEGERENARARFTPPTVEEVRAYCLDRNNGIDPETFVDYYTARGWELSKGRKLKDWKAAVRTWEKNEFNRGSSAQATAAERDDSKALERIDRLMENM